MTKNYLTPEEMRKALLYERIIERRMNRAAQSMSADTVMKTIERLRKERHKRFPACTQEYLAKHGGISRSTYQSYLDLFSGNLRLDTLLGFASALECDPADFFISTDAQTACKKNL